MRKTRHCGPRAIRRAPLLPLAALTELAPAPCRSSGIRLPALFVFSDQDKVVRPDLTRAIAGALGRAARASGRRAQRRSVTTSSPVMRCRRRQRMRSPSA